MVRRTSLGLLAATLFALSPVVDASDGLQPWELWGQLPANVTGDTPAGTDTHWYAFEDRIYSGGPCVGTSYAEIAPDGTIGPWMPATDRTQARWLFSAASTDSHMYLAGGKVLAPFTGNTGLVEYAPLNNDGSIGTWETTSALNNPRESFGLVVSGDHLYALGGTIHVAGFGVGRITEYARINPDGSLGAWQMGPQLNERHPNCSAAAIGGYVYVFAGGVHYYGTQTVERAAINPDGSLGQWEYDTPLPEYRAEMGIAVFDDTIYIGGGFGAVIGSDPLTSVISTTVQADGTLGEWTQEESLIQATTYTRFVKVGPHVFATFSSRDYIEHSVVNGSPTCETGGPYVGECEGGWTAVQLDGTGSSDPDGDALGYWWETDCPGGWFDDPAGAGPVLNVDTSGGCSVGCGVTLTVDDGNGGTAECATTVSISDTQPPVVLCSATPLDGHRLMIEYSAADACGDVTGGAVIETRCCPLPVVSGQVVRVACEDEEECELTLDFEDDVFEIKANTAALVVTATDACGNTATCVVDLCVADDEDDFTEGNHHLESMDDRR